MIKFLNKVTLNENNFKRRDRLKYTSIIQDIINYFYFPSTWMFKELKMDYFLNWKSSKTFWTTIILVFFLWLLNVCFEFQCHCLALQKQIILLNNQIFVKSNKFPVVVTICVEFFFEFFLLVINACRGILYIFLKQQKEK